MELTVRGGGTGPGIAATACVVAGTGEADTGTFSVCEASAEPCTTGLAGSLGVVLSHRKPALAMPAIAKATQPATASDRTEPGTGADGLTTCRSTKESVGAIADLGACSRLADRMPGFAFAGRRNSNGALAGSSRGSVRSRITACDREPNERFWKTLRTTPRPIFTLIAECSSDKVISGQC
jgi:hypothetical protein